MPSISKKLSKCTVAMAIVEQGSDKVTLACVQRAPLARGLHKAKETNPMPVTYSNSAWSCKTGREVQVILKMDMAYGKGEVSLP
jgi:hypothetical protein